MLDFQIFWHQNSDKYFLSTLVKGHFLALDISVPHQKGTFLLLMGKICLFDIAQNQNNQNNAKGIHIFVIDTFVPPQNGGKQL